MKDLLVWWFSPKKRLSSVIKIPIGLLICYSFVYELIKDSLNIVYAIRNPPLFIGISQLIRPAIANLFIGIIAGIALFYIPYCILGSKKKYLIRILMTVLIVGIAFGTTALKEYIAPYYPTIEVKELTAAQDKLGEMDENNDFYTLREFGYDIAKLTKPLPDILVQNSGFSKLVLFYKECEKEWEEYNLLPGDMESAIASISEKLYRSDNYYLAGILWLEYEELPRTPTSLRKEYRINHPGVDARLLFWGISTESAFLKGTKGADEVTGLLSSWFNDYKINKKMHPLFAHW